MNILLADDHELFREGMILLLRKVFPLANVIHASNWLEVQQTVGQQALSLTLLDLSMPGQRTWEMELTEVMRVVSGITCIVSGSGSPAHVKQALGMGVRGYIPKTMAMTEMESALQCLMAGGVYLPDTTWFQGEGEEADATPSALLTWRQRELLTLLAQGNSNKQIATLLELSEGTVKRHLYNIFNILGASNRLDAVNIARERHLLVNL